MKEEYKSQDEIQALCHLVEELGEVTAAAGKSLRFGLDCYNPEIPESERETNRVWLAREMRDLEEAWAMFRSLQEDA